MLIDNLLPTFDVKERHQTIVHAPLVQVYAAARRLDISRGRLSMLLFLLRGIPTGRAPYSFSLDDFPKMRFILLGERLNEELLLGLVGRFWTPTGDLQRLDAKEFHNFIERGHAKAAMNFTLSKWSASTVLLATEPRVYCLDDISRRRFKRFWAMIVPFSGLIRWEVLRAIRRRVESLSAQAAL